MWVAVLSFPMRKHADTTGTSFLLRREKRRQIDSRKLGRHNVKLTSTFSPIAPSNYSLRRTFPFPIDPPPSRPESHPTPSAVPKWLKSFEPQIRAASRTWTHTDRYAYMRSTLKPPHQNFEPQLSFVSFFLYLPETPLRG